MDSYEQADGQSYEHAAPGLGAGAGVASPMHVRLRASPGTALLCKPRVASSEPCLDKKGCLPSTMTLHKKVTSRPKLA